MIFNPVFGGGAAPVLGTKTITANGTYLASADSLDGYDEVTANVPNTYAAGDEGKVVYNGALTAQTSESITQNGTYDTTLKNQVVVNVSGGGGGGWTQQTPTNYDSTAGFPNASGGWTSSSTGNVRTDVYQVSAGKVYYFTTTSVVGNRYRVAFYTNNPVVAGSGAGAVSIYYNSSSCPTNFPLAYLPSSNGYIAINKTADATNNLVVKFYEAEQPV